MVSFTHQDQGTAASCWQQAGLGRIATLDPEDLFREISSVIVLAAHPDDETLGAGGLIRMALCRGIDVHVIVCSFGEASHPHSATHTAAQLASLRKEELAEAMGTLRVQGPQAGTLHLHCLGLGDGKLETQQARIRAALEQHAAQGCLIASTYRADGHPDHEILSLIAADCALTHHACHLEFPIWYWHWAQPDSQRSWKHWHRLDLDESSAQAKARALDAHRSQTRPLSALPGDEVLLGESFLQHFSQGAEIFRATWPGHRDAASAPAVFDELYGTREDPWEYRSSRYERRKQQILLACLPQERYAAVLELGCSIGVQSAELARRSTRLLAVDASATALAQARRAVAGMDHVELLHATVPRQFPQLEPGSLQLVVLSEMGYFLAADELEQVLAASAAALQAGGELVLCHWLHPIDGWPLDGEEVHRIAGQLRWERIVEHREADFLLEILRKPAGAHG
ncbi:bifunctional PIG-L family deacetylase/class I SAM-dependent methyltransferase [Glutamicibacter mysorens]|uniref:bifunctional PIG-L family deacetylase/class I SAM-dependent methyltransferase n=1 Tax=Glutamicibacter mysorens TaxID=257984 RepID=UPI0020C71DA7|nr:bifunctional PIG-L family deacetylase/class I SAM-dependent methyltransferase [Glutamicibacter mysorens]UTM47496.1 PIG-L family deacetylase [Glutamicibacter mysorens]